MRPGPVGITWIVKIENLENRDCVELDRDVLLSALGCSDELHRRLPEYKDAIDQLLGALEAWHREEGCMPQEATEAVRNARYLLGPPRCQSISMDDRQCSRDTGHSGHHEITQHWTDADARRV